MGEGRAEARKGRITEARRRVVKGKAKEVAAEGEIM